MMMMAMIRRAHYNFIKYIFKIVKTTVNITINVVNNS